MQKLGLQLIHQTWFAVVVDIIKHFNHRLSMSSGDKKIHQTKSKRKKTDPNFDESFLFKVSIKYTHRHIIKELLYAYEYTTRRRMLEECR